MVYRFGMDIYRLSMCKDRMDFYIIAINFLGAELMTFFDKEKANFNFYYDKVKFILNENEKNQ